MFSGRKHAGGFSAHYAGADGQAAAQALGRGKEIRRNAVVHIAIKLSGAAVAGLHFV